MKFGRCSLTRNDALMANTVDTVDMHANFHHFKFWQRIASNSNYYSVNRCSLILNRHPFILMSYFWISILHYTWSHNEDDEFNKLKLHFFSEPIDELTSRYAFLNYPCLNTETIATLILLIYFYWNNEWTHSGNWMKEKRMERCERVINIVTCNVDFCKLQSDFDRLRWHLAINMHRIHLLISILRLTVVPRQFHSFGGGWEGGELNNDKLTTSIFMKMLSNIFHYI